MTQQTKSLSSYISEKIIKNKEKNRTSYKKTPLVMTHIVAGYPSIEANKEQARIMADAGASFLEVQLPFSDPLADGPIIMAANQRSLENDTNLKTCFNLLQNLSSTLSIPIIAMTYYNIPFRMKINKYCQRLNSCGVTATIVPDIPFDEERENFYSIAQQNHVDVIPILSQTMEERRLFKILKITSPLLYVTLRIGITGGKKERNEAGFTFLKKLRSITTTPIAAGFGISTPQQISYVANYADIAIVGSHIMQLVDSYGLLAAETFLRESLNT